MILTNELLAYKNKNSVWPLTLENRQFLLQILAPFAPYLAVELWEKLGNKESIFKSSWPQYDKNLIKDEIINLAVSINGKLRTTLEVVCDISKEEAIKLAHDNEIIKKWLEGKEVLKNIFVPGRLLNIVIR